MYKKLNKNKNKNDEKDFRKCNFEFKQKFIKTMKKKKFF